MEINLPESEYDFEWYDPTGTLVATTSASSQQWRNMVSITAQLTGCNAQQQSIHKLTAVFALQCYPCLCSRTCDTGNCNGIGDYG